MNIKVEVHPYGKRIMEDGSIKPVGYMGLIAQNVGTKQPAMVRGASHMECIMNALSVLVPYNPQAKFGTF